MLGVIVIAFYNTPVSKINADGSEDFSISDDNTEARKYQFTNNLILSFIGYFMVFIGFVLQLVDSLLPDSISFYGSKSSWHRWNKAFKRDSRRSASSVQGSFGVYGVFKYHISVAVPW